MRICQNCKTEVKNDWATKCPHCQKSVQIGNRQVAIVWIVLLFLLLLGLTIFHLISPYVLFVIFLLLLLGAFPLLLLGMVKPGTMKLLFKNRPTRKKIIVAFVIAVVVSFIGMTSVVAADQKDFSTSDVAPTPTPTMAPKNPSPTPTQASKPKVKPTSVPKKVVVKPTKAPTPTMDCSQSAYPQACIQAEIAQEPKLNATVDFSDYGIVITNNDKVDWTLCDITIGADVDLNNAYELGGWNNTFPAGQTVTVPWADIVQDNGNRFNYETTKPQDVDIDCSVNKQDEHLRIN